MPALGTFARAAVLSLALMQAPVLAVAPALAQMPPMGKPDYALAPAGTYALDEKHAAVVARVSHVGYSFSIFRFDKVTGSLTWDPAAPEASKLSVTAKTASIATNVEGFAAELGGDKFLKSAAFPDATFVSTSFRKTDATHGVVTGDFTLMGKTKPLSFNVTLIGAGPGFRNKPRMGVHATGAINPQDFGLPPMFSAPIELVIDAEFAQP